MLESVTQIVATTNEWLWGWPMIILLFGCHLFLTIRLKFPQRKIFTGIKLSISKDGDAEGDVSQFGALVTSLASTIGIGNIVGVATAVTLGGPGAVMWCWMSGILGIATKYAESLLAVKYRQKDEEGKMQGGAMYVIEHGMGKQWRWLAVLFAIFTICASLGLGSTVQSNAFAVVVNSSLGIPKYVSGLLLTLAIGSVLFFGVKGIVNVCTRLIPFMMVIYVGGCLALLIINGSYVWDAIQLIVTSAFSPQAAGGGFAGAAVISAARFGIARGLFSNESGLGSAPIVAAAAKSRNPVRQALVSSTGTFWDTVVICALTGIVLVSTMLSDPHIADDHSSLLTELAFRKIPYIGTAILTLSLMTFSFSTILGWSYYVERVVQYLGGRKIMHAFLFAWVGVVFLGSVLELRLVWNIADIMNALMSIPNIISLIVLSGIAARDTKYYLWDGHLDESTEEHDV